MKYTVKIFEDGKAIDHANITKEIAIKIQDLLDKELKIKHHNVKTI